MIQIDIDMPEKCGLCPLFHAEHPMYCQGVEADRKKKIVAPYRDPRPEWCPLHEVTADEDTISRKQAIEVAMQYCPDDDGSCSKSDRDIRELLDDLENLPPSQPQRKKGMWIPVTRIEKWHKEDGLVGFPPEVKEFPQCTIEWVDATEPDEVDGLRCSECGTVYDFTEARNWCSECGADMRTPVETARDIVHEAIDNSVWLDTVDTAEMHKVVDDKYAEIRG